MKALLESAKQDRMPEALYDVAEKYDCDYTECSYEKFDEIEELTDVTQITEDYNDEVSSC